MTAIIRPHPQVFARTLPLMLVHGAFRRPEQPIPFGEPLAALMRDAIGTARGYRWPLAFWRRLERAELSPEGTWLPGCRPRVSDRVFEGTEITAFANREFRSLLLATSTREIHALGLAVDSEISAAKAEAEALGIRLTLVSGPDVLQDCSGVSRSRDTTPIAPVEEPDHNRIGIRAWKDSLRVLE